MEKHSKEKIIAWEIYTDGSCKKYGQKMTFGGWSFIVVKDSKQVYADYGSSINTTNQKMELTAVVQALQYITKVRRPCDRVVIYTDSAYIVNCYLKEWYIGWMRNGWKNYQNKDVANQELWYEIIPYFDDFWYSFKKVPGHQGNYWNEQCDQLAQSASEQLKRDYKGVNI